MNSLTRKKLASALTVLLFISVFTEVALATGKTWTGAHDSNWDDPDNWSPAGVPTYQDDVTFTCSCPNPNATIPISGFPSRAVQNLTVGDGVIITLGKEIHIYGTEFTGGITSPAIFQTTNGKNVHVVTGTTCTFFGKVRIDYFNPEPSAGAVVATNSVIEIMKQLNLDGDIELSTDAELIFRSTATGTAVINFPLGHGTISTSSNGKVKVERYIGGISGYRQVGAPVSMNLGQFADGGSGGYYIPAPGYAPCDENLAAGSSPHSAIWSWHEDNPTSTTCHQVGWFAEASATTAVPGKGYLAAITGNGNIKTYTGLPNQNDSYTITGLGNSNWSSETQQSLQTPFNYVSGWHLLSNPYQSNYSMSLAISANPGFDDASVFAATGAHHGSYQPLLIPTLYDPASGGVINGGYIAPGQGVLVHRSSGVGDFTFNIYDCNPLPTPAYYKQSSGEGLTITVSGNGHEDYTYLGFSEEATSGFDIGFDSRKLSSNQGAPTLYTLNNGTFMSVNTYQSIQQTSSVELGVWPGANGTFTLTFGGIGNFDEGTIIILEDKATGQMTDLRLNNTSIFTQNLTDNPDRFVLHFSGNVASGIKANTNEAIRLFSADNILFVDFSNIKDVDATIEAYNSLGQKIMSEKYSSTGIYSKPLSGIESGYIMVRVANGNVVQSGKLSILNRY